MLKNDWGEFKRRIYRAPIKPGNMQAHWPDKNVRLDRGKRSPEVGVPNYSAVTRLEKVIGAGKRIGNIGREVSGRC